MPWKKISSEVFLDDYFKIMKDKVELPNGEVVDNYYHAGDHASVVVPLLNKNEVVLIRNYRYTAGKKMLEVPAGRLDSGETDEECALRELEEETGYKAGKIVKLGEIMDWVLSTSKLSIFAATDLTLGKQELTKFEELEVVTMTWDEINEEIKKYSSTTSSLSALMLVKDKLEELTF